MSYNTEATENKAKMTTPNEKHDELARIIGVKALYFKREDLHPYGSHKGRSIPVMIDHYRRTGENRFAISSSGNAALAAALYIRELNSRTGATNGDDISISSAGPISLSIFTGANINPAKLSKLESLTDENIRISREEHPLRALATAVSDGARSLRQSTDDVALAGYHSLAEELREIGNISAVFIGTSSGTTAQALAQYFLENPPTPEVHIVQTSSCHPISDVFHPTIETEEKSLADAIVDKAAHRKGALVPLLERTGGRGWIATNDEILAAMKLSANHSGVEISPNSALSLAGLVQAVADMKNSGREWQGAAVCIISGQ